MHSLSDVRSRIVPPRAGRVRTPKSERIQPAAMRPISATPAPECSPAALRAVLAALPDAVVVIDAGERVLYATPAAEQVLRRSVDELVGNALGIQIVEDETAEIGLTRVDGSECTVEMRVAPMTFEGRPARIVTLRDVTARSTAEDAMRRDLERHVRRTTCGRIARDYRDLLTTIHCGAQLIEAEGSETPDLVQLATKVVSAAETASNLTHRLLTVAGERVRSASPMSLDAAMRDFAARMTPLLEERLSFDVHLGAPDAQLEMSPEHLEQILDELVQNALDALPRGGQLTIRTSLRDVQGSVGGPHAGRYAVISVADTGKGMGAATRAHLFEPYYSTKDQRRGRGLGMAEVYGLVAQAEGFVEVESAENEGTRIDVLLPRSGTPNPDEPSCEQPKGGLAGRTILLTEDEEGIRRLLGEVLEGAGARLITAGTVQEARACLESAGDSIELLIADVRMPDGNGIELVGTARAAAPDLPAILMSGFSARMPLAGTADGPTEFLPKPFLPSALLELAERLVSA